MAQYTKIGKSKWRVRYAAGSSLDGKRQVINKTITGTKRDAEKWAAALERERFQSGTVNGAAVITSADLGVWLYALRMCIPNYHDCPIKVGMTTEPDKRRKSFDGSGPYPIEWIGCWPAANGRNSERVFHERFRQYRLSGEWFFPNADLLAAIEQEIRKQSKAA